MFCYEVSKLRVTLRYPPTWRNAICDVKELIRI